MITDEQVRAALDAWCDARASREEWRHTSATDHADMRAALEAAEAVAWQDKANQPKGRVRVLGGRYDHEGQWVEGVTHTPLVYPFTHWRHLPASPKDAQP